MSNINESRAKKVASAILAKIRAKHMKEDVEELDELSKRTLGAYGSKSIRAGLNASSSGDEKTADKRFAGVNRASAKMYPNQYKNSPLKAKVNATNEEVENLDELSKNTLKNYVKKAANRTAYHTAQQMVARDPGNMDYHGKKAMNKVAGISKAADKLTKEEADQIGEGKTIGKKSSYPSGTITVGNKKYPSPEKAQKAAARGVKKFGAGSSDIYSYREEAEELDELSKGTLNSYVIKSLNPRSEKSISNLASKGGFEQGERGDTDPSAGEKEDAKSVKRSLGVLTAVRKLAKEEAKDLEELSNKALEVYAKNSYNDYLKKSSNRKPGEDETSAMKKRKAGWELAHKKGAFKESVDECMTDTSLSNVKPSSTGEVYKKESETSTAATKPTGTKTGVTSAKTGEAYNTTSMTKRMPALEHSIMGVMQRTFELKKLYAEAADITVVTSEQREDWMSVERGTMNVVDYFNKYKIAGE